MRHPTKRSTALLAVTMILACDSRSKDPASTKPPATSAASSPRASSSATTRPTSTPSVARSAPRSVASLRKAAADDRSAFEGEPVALDAFFVRVAQKQFGTGEHPRHHFAKVDVALAPFAPDAPEGPEILACFYPERSWPPRDLQPGDPVVVTGRWSFAQLLAGGWRPGAGPLHIAACSVKRASSER